MRRFQLGFPLHTAPGHPGYVLVDAINGQSHVVAGGKRGRLRRGSGAEQAFDLAPPNVREHCRFEFTQFPETPPNTEPWTLVDSGNSDGGACALALAKPHGFKPGEYPTVLVSCALNQVEQRQGLRGVKLAPVTDRSAPEPENLESLTCKWEAAAEASARGSALVLCRSDAELLAGALGLAREGLDALAGLGPGKTVLIAVDAEDMPALAGALGAEPSLFEFVDPVALRSGRRASDRRRALLPGLVLGLAVLASLIVALWLWKQLDRTKVVGFESGSRLVIGQAGSLRVVGIGLEQGLEDWGPRWCAALTEQGLDVETCALAPGPGGESLDLPIRVPRGYLGSGRLPLPDIGDGPTRYDTIVLDRELRVLYLGYERRKKEPYRFLLQGFVSAYNDAHPDEGHFVLTEDYRAQAELLDMKESIIDGQWDIVRLTPYNYVYLRNEVGRNNLRMMICNNDVTDEGIPSSLYHANLFTRPGLLPRDLGNDPDRVGAEIVREARARELNVVWYFGQKHSTSGYVIPCGVWSGFVSQHASRVETDMTNEALVKYVLQEPGPGELRVGVMYDEKLQQLSEKSNLSEPPQVLWQSMPLPHGGIALYAPDEPWRATMLEELLAFIELGTLSDEQRGEIDRFGDCATARFDIVDQWMWHRQDLLTQTCRLPYPSGAAP